MPSPSSTLQPSNQAFYDNYHQKNQPFAKVVSDNNFTYFFHLRALRPFLSQTNLSNLSVLDVGCGVGTLSLYLAKKGVQKVLGIDLSARAIALANHARDALSLHNTEFKQTELTPKLGQFNLIIASEIIEHVPDPAEFVANLYANLKPGGSLLLSTPYAHNWLRDHGCLQHHDQVAGHLRIYDEKSLTKLLLQPGYRWRITSLEKNEGPLRMLLFTTPLGELIRIIKGPLVPLFHTFDDLLAKIWGQHDLLVKVQKD